MIRRIEFTEAVSEPGLLAKPWHEKLTPLQQTVCLSIYGLPLQTDAQHEAWAHLCEQREIDRLGYPQPGLPVSYIPERFNEVCWVAGRRSGKTDVSAMLMAYEATCGAHENWLARKQLGVCFLVCQDQKLGNINLNFIRGYLEDSPILNRQLLKEPTVEWIDLQAPEPGMGRLRIQAIPPRRASMRGPACPVAVFDELVAWPTDPDAADPDEDIYNLLRKAMAQFPDRLLVAISSAGFEEGLLWKMYTSGTKGSKLPEGMRLPWQSLLLLHSTTGGSGNPLVTAPNNPTWLEIESYKPDFERECLSIFQQAKSGALNQEMIAAAVQQLIWERPAQADIIYTAVMDPAFRNDSYALVIGHLDQDANFVEDVVREWKPEGEVLDPGMIVGEIATIARKFLIPTIYTDQHHAESLEYICLQHGLSIYRVPFSQVQKQKMLSNFETLLKQRRVKLLDHAEQTKQLLHLQKVKGQSGGVQIRGPKGEHDDIVMALLLCAQRAVWQGPAVEPEKPKPKTLVEEGLEQALRIRKGQIRADLTRTRFPW